MTTIIDHLSVGVNDLDHACQFYSELLTTLDIPLLAKTDHFGAFGTSHPQFIVIKPEDGNLATAGNGVHICFVAPSPMAVDMFYARGLILGGSDGGAPGVREAYPMPDVYAAFIRDPWGNKLEAIHNGFVK